MYSVIQSLPLCMLPSPFSSWDSCGMAFPLSSWVFSWSCKNVSGSYLQPLRSAVKWADSNASTLVRHFFLSTLGESSWQILGTEVVFSQTISFCSILTQQGRKLAITLHFKQISQTLPWVSLGERSLYFLSIYWLFFPCHVEIRNWPKGLDLGFLESFLVIGHFCHLLEVLKGRDYFHHLSRSLIESFKISRVVGEGYH